MTERRDIEADSCSLEGFLSLMWDAADLLADSVEVHCKDDKYMDIHAMVQAMTVQVVGTTAFGCATYPTLTVAAKPTCLLHGTR